MQFSHDLALIFKKNLQPTPVFVIKIHIKHFLQPAPVFVIKTSPSPIKKAFPNTKEKRSGAMKPTSLPYNWVVCSRVMSGDCFKLGSHFIQGHTTMLTWVLYYNTVTWVILVSMWTVQYELDIFSAVNKLYSSLNTFCCQRTSKFTVILLNS